MSEAPGVAASSGPDEEDQREVILNNDLERRIAEAFDIFDVGNNKMCEARDVPTIMRGLGMCPTEAGVQEVIVAVEHPRIPGSVHLRHFLPVIVQAITEHRFEPAGPEELLEAFKALDVLGKGYLTKEDAVMFMTQDGEPFSQEEIDEMLELAVDPLSQTVPYEYYINQLLVEES
ncbi:unnamed protein product [Phyllotreta striolata]|uniref:EF-hand domain-containing protein n=1 Tax=Phyllotreta striolata TaxID=444603 RepID=A0A9N9TJN5_PHYSR|nr:unnamed protein product [Phyllotreta striolata]